MSAHAHESSEVEPRIRVKVRLVRFPVHHEVDQCGHGYILAELEPMATMEYLAAKTFCQWRDAYLPEIFGISHQCFGMLHTEQDFYDENFLELYVSVPEGMTVEDPEDYLRRNYMWL